jgi:hypothetical protein
MHIHIHIHIHMEACVYVGTHTWKHPLSLLCIYIYCRDLHVEAAPHSLVLLDNGDQSLEDNPEFRLAFACGFRV